MKHLWIILNILITAQQVFSQAAPAVDENIPYLMTFGGNSSTSWEMMISVRYSFV